MIQFWEIPQLVESHMWITPLQFIALVTSSLFLPLIKDIYDSSEKGTNIFTFGMSIYDLYVGFTVYIF